MNGNVGRVPALTHGNNQHGLDLWRPVITSVCCALTAQHISTRVRCEPWTVHTSLPILAHVRTRPHSGCNRLAL